jgi:hypothetical protein
MIFRNDRRRRGSRRKKGFRRSLLVSTFAVVSGLVLGYFLTPQAYRTQVFARLVQNTPLANFVTIDYETGLSITAVRDVAKLRTAYMAIDYLISATDSDGNRYISIIPYEVAAGFDLENHNPDTTPGDQLQLPAPTILSVDSGQQTASGVIRDTIKDMNYDTYIKPLRVAMELHAEDAAIDSGLLNEASDNFKQWYGALFDSVDTAEEEYVVPEISIPAPESPFVTTRFERYPIALRMNSDSEVTIEVSTEGPYLSGFTGDGIEGKVIVQAETRVDSGRIAQAFDATNDSDQRVVSRIYDPRDPETGGIIVVNDGTTQVATYQVFGRDTVAAVIEADNLAIAPDRFGQAIYVMLGLRPASPGSEALRLQYLGMINLFRRLTEEWRSQNWDSAIGMQADFEHIGVSGIARFLSLMELSKNDGLGMSDWAAGLSLQQQDALQIYDFITALDDPDRETDSDFWKDAEMALKNQEGWSANEITSLQMYMLQEMGGNLDDAERDHLVAQLVEQYGISSTVWDFADRDNRKRLVFNEFNSGVLGSGSSRYWHRRDGVRFLAISPDELTLALGPQLWWARPYGVSPDVDEYVEAPFSEQEIRQEIDKIVPRGSRTSRDLENGVVLVVPSTRLRDTVNVFILGDDGVTRIELIKRVFQDPLATVTGPITMRDVAESTLGLSSVAAPVANSFFERLSQQFREEQQAERQLRVQLEQALRARLLLLFPLPEVVPLSSSGSANSQ